MFSWVEHDPYDILDSVDTCIEHAVRKLGLMGYDASDIECVGITNQRETTVAWDSETGHPLCPAIVWSDNRTSHTVHELSKESGINALAPVCGLPITTYFSAVKLKWMLTHVSAVKDAFKNNRLQFGTIDSWLIYVSIYTYKKSG